MSLTWKTWRPDCMISHAMSVYSFFRLAHICLSMLVFRHPKNLAASSSRVITHGICLVMHTSRLLTTWVAWLGYARSSYTFVESPAHKLPRAFMYYLLPLFFIFVRGAQPRTLGWDKWRSDIRWELDPGSRAGMIGAFVWARWGGCPWWFWSEA